VSTEGDDTGYGQALFPVPADDPNDPLQWPNYKKTMILIICASYSFLGNSSLLGPSVYIGIYAESFGISASTASGLISYPNLAYGFGTFDVYDVGIFLFRDVRGKERLTSVQRVFTTGTRLPEVRSSARHVAFHHCRKFFESSLLSSPYHRRDMSLLLTQFRSFPSVRRGLDWFVSM
jgi:hypothetical protein